MTGYPDLRRLLLDAANALDGSPPTAEAAETARYYLELLAPLGEAIAPLVSGLMRARIARNAPPAVMPDRKYADALRMCGELASGVAALVDTGDIDPAYAVLARYREWSKR